LRFKPRFESGGVFFQLSPRNVGYFGTSPQVFLASISFRRFFFYLRFDSKVRTVVSFYPTSAPKLSTLGRFGNLSFPPFRSSRLLASTERVTAAHYQNVTRCRFLPPASLPLPNHGPIDRWVRWNVEAHSSLLFLKGGATFPPHLGWFGGARMEDNPHTCAHFVPHDSRQTLCVLDLACQSLRAGY